MTTIHPLAKDERENESNDETSGGWRVLGIGFGTYAILATLFAGAGVFTKFDTNLFPATVVFATVTLTLSYFYVPSIRALAERLGPYGLAAFHVWRIPAALMFLYYDWHGLLPMTFVNLAGWGDMLAGVLAALVMVLPRRTRTITGFHVIGFLDFVVAVGTGITLNLIAPSSMANIMLLPVALIPLIGVPISGATHIAALHMLWKQRRVA
ncbi:MAG: permease [Pseudomonadota bacterium]